MADETKANAEAAAEAPAKVVEVVAETAAKVVEKSAPAAKRGRTKTAPTPRKVAAKAAPKPARSTRAKAAKPSRKAPRKVAAAASQQRIETMATKNYFAGFDAIPAFAPFQSLFTDAGERGQEAVRRTQKVAEELADLTRANVEAVVESGRVAAEGVRSLSQDVVASSRDGFEKAADAIRTLAEAKSPTEYLQLHSELARTSFDRMVAESSRWTESFVKLAGEAIQPVSSRASANAERLNSLVA
ncbi:phasin family protein [Sphingomonas piscis]|uniref:Phasin family protein n=1 Tax=Sphingomonas piscis TaxID=2714943 RepID=A0A6G7YP13_9SPHN|nr:phasin family protein [Sphingomonas piscis]QIK78482.1 phasin family protein [Sphingomonas piscis]